MAGLQNLSGTYWFMHQFVVRRPVACSITGRTGNSEEFKGEIGIHHYSGSEQVRYTAGRDGLLDKFEKIGGVVLANAVDHV